MRGQEIWWHTPIHHPMTKSIVEEDQYNKLHTLHICSNLLLAWQCVDLCLTILRWYGQIITVTVLLLLFVSYHKFYWYNYDDDTKAIIIVVTIIDKHSKPGLNGRLVQPLFLVKQADGISQKLITFSKAIAIE